MIRGRRSPVPETRGTAGAVPTSTPEVNALSCKKRRREHAPPFILPEVSDKIIEEMFFTYAAPEEKRK
jgi:hypothetical protein